MNNAIEHLLAKARHAQDLGQPGPMSTGEAVAVALILDRPDWLALMNYTLADAIERVGPEWLAAIPEVARQLHIERDQAAYAAAERAKTERLAALDRASDYGVEFTAELVTYGHAPGYRDATLVFDLRPIGSDKQPPLRASIRVGAGDGEDIARHIVDVHRSAWGRVGAEAPIDAKPGEVRPGWIDRI